MGYPYGESKQTLLFYLDIKYILRIFTTLITG